MRAMVLDAVAPIEESPLVWREVAEPVPGPNELLLKVRCCGVCRTDLHVIEGELPSQRLPLIPGHQVVGVVEQAGAHCSGWAPGDRAGVAWLRHTCGECDYCLRGNENLCEASRYTGYHADGGYAEYAVVPAEFAYRIPDVFSDTAAAPLLCAGIIGYRALERAAVPDGGALALYGFGSSAHIVLQLALHRGHRVVVVSRTPEHQELAREMGAEWAGKDASDMPVRPDSAISFAPVGHIVPGALENLRPGGTLALAGVYMTDVPRLNYEKHLFHERDLRSVTSNTRDDGRNLLEEAAQIPVRAEVTAYPVEDANRALQDLKADRVNGSAVLQV